MDDGDDDDTDDDDTDDDTDDDHDDIVNHDFSILCCLPIYDLCLFNYNISVLIND